MQQIADWLGQLGLGQYAPRFAENDINFAILPDLTDQDLKELGVSSLGHRRQLLRAIAELNTVEKGAPKRAPATAAPVTPQPQNAAERRQLTVMFCDLVGSTALSARLDPEDMREIVGVYHRSCAEQIAKAGGFVAKYMGDGVLAYFGYPQAHEHDAERAVLAGLALVEAVPKLTTAVSTALQVRIGIATGLVVVGDLIGSGEAQERGVVGDTPNLAARLQALAEPNMVVIADSTRRLLGNLFELRDLGARDLKGIAGPARAWAALRASSVESRFEALHSTNLTALVGREEEFELLLRRWSRAKTGEGQVVLLSGEAGIGKSRLTAAVPERLATEPHTRLRYFCSPQHTDSAFYPIIGQMVRAAGLAHDDKPQAKLDKLDAVLAQTSTSTEDAALFAEMLSLANDGRYPALELAPEQRRQRTLEALTLQLAELARRQPVLMIFEDAHWTDPTSLEAFGRTVDRIKTLPVLLIVTFRPEFNAPWAGQSHVTSLALNRLGEREAAAIIARLVGNKALPADVLAEIVERTDGIPLFVEEMTKAVLEAESEGAARRTVAAVPSSALAVPASLQASLMARLDRLGPAKDMASLDQARLYIEHAEALGEPPEDPLLLFSVLYGFCAANFMAFNGDAVRDLAAQFLTLAEKQRATIPLMIGHRLMGTSLVLTGDIAASRGHLDQAIALYDPALHRPLAMRFGQDVGVTILSYRSFALWLLGYSEAALRDADDALKKAREMGQAATLMYALATIPYTFFSNYAAAAEQAQELVGLAEEKGSPFWKAIGMMNRGNVLALTARASDATDMLISGIAAYRTTGATARLPLHLPHLARAHAELGQFEEAWRCIGEAMTAVETTKEKWCEAEVHRVAGEIALKSPEPDAAKAQVYFERALEVARQQQAKSWELRAATSLTRLWRDQGKRRQARDLLAPIYGWFTEGFDTLDLKQAKVLLDELHA